MKYRAAATQIKEIPIIFRGTIDGAGATGPDPIIDITQETIEQQSINIVNITISDSDVVETLYMRVNGDYFAMNRNKITSGVYYYGASLNVSTGTADFSEYPFGLMISTQPGGVFASAYFETPGSKHVEIWTSEPTFNEAVKSVFSADLTGNGQIKRFHCRFALGENGTLHIRPYVILNGNIRVDLCAFASNGDNYISGDNEEIAFDCYVPVETHAVAYVEAENVGEYESILDAAMVVQYEDFIEPESIVGYEGINLRRGK